jgi:hypothetical protein
MAIFVITPALRELPVEQPGEPAIEAGVGEIRLEDERLLVVGDRLRKRPSSCSVTPRLLKVGG